MTFGDAPRRDFLAVLAGLIGTGATRPAGSVRGNTGQQPTGPLGDGLRPVNGPATDALRAAIRSRRGGITELGRAFGSVLKLPAGRYYIDDVIDLAALGSIRGLIVEGEGDASTEIVFTTPAATIKGSGCLGITFRDLTFRSLDKSSDATVSNSGARWGVDLDQTAFTLDWQPGQMPLRWWNFERCIFAGFYRCFRVTGDSFVDGFKFSKIVAANCYHFLHNANENAVNWNFFDVDWENAELETRRNRDLSAMFLLEKGTAVTWVGGSAVYHGALIRAHFTTPNSFPASSHVINIIGVRHELEPNSAQSHAPIIDRIDMGNVNGGNALTVTFIGNPMLNRGKIPSSVILAKLWNNCSLSLINCNWEGGVVLGLVDDITETQNGSLYIENSSPSIRYVEDRSRQTDRRRPFVSHAVTIRYAEVGTQQRAPVNLRNAGALAQSRPEQTIVWEGLDGQVDPAGDPVTIPDLGLRAFVSDIFVDLTIPMTSSAELRLTDASGRTVYATLNLPRGERRASAPVNQRAGAGGIAQGAALRWTGGNRVPGLFGVRYR